MSIQLERRPIMHGFMASRLTIDWWVSGIVNRLSGTLIYAGRFDPPTVGHRRIVEALDRYAVSLSTSGQGDWRVVVWLHGTYGSKEVYAPIATRQEWVRQLVSGLSRTEARLDAVTSPNDERAYISQMEMYRAYRTVPLVTVEEETYAMPANVIQVIGADNVAHIKHWEEPEELWKRN